MKSFFKLSSTLVLLVASVTAWSRPPVFATPDQAELIRAARSLQDGFEKDAFDKFLMASAWGNKEAQKSVALMYIKGLGVEKDWAKAYAWMRLAASTGVPKFVAAREEIRGALREDEKERAETYFKGLVPEYGDLAALQRREEWVRKQKREVTGSRLGNVGALRIQVPDATGYQWELSGHEYFRVLDTYVVELKEHVGEVEFGELEVIEPNEEENEDG